MRGGRRRLPRRSVDIAEYTTPGVAPGRNWAGIGKIRVHFGPKLPAQAQPVKIAGPAFPQQYD